jgi:hypothetical protein
VLRNLARRGVGDATGRIIEWPTLVIWEHEE